MDNRFAPHLQWLDSEYPASAHLLRTWADVNSGSRNIEGLSAMLGLVSDAFSPLGGMQEVIPLEAGMVIEPDGSVSTPPLGKAFRVVVRPEARPRVLLNIHYDTVYGPDHPFQSCVLLDDHILQGPGVADAKGGLLVMLKALQALERTPWAGNLGWEVIVNPDEEIGSPGSTPLFLDAAARNDLGLVFEPAWRDGSLVSTRKGSSVYTALIRGRSAHAGRNPADGRNAVNAVAEFVVQLNSVFRDKAGTTLNVGAITGGGPANVVPDVASCTFNVRTESLQDDHIAYTLIEELIDQINKREGLTAELYRNSWRPPKMIDHKTLELMSLYDRCAEEVGCTVSWRAAGGAGDGSVLASAGLTTLDGLGPIGDNLHSPQEYVVLPSIMERAKVAALLLMKLAAGEIRWDTSGAGPSRKAG